MTTDHDMLAKFYRASTILHRCFGRRGVWAGTSRYKDTCWTRDFALAILPLLLQLGEVEMARAHLASLSELQRPNGQIPIVFLDNENRWVRHKTDERLGRGEESFMLRSYKRGELWNLTPGTRDSEILYIIAMFEYAEATGDFSLLDQNKDRITSALAYIESHLMEDGLVLGADWRDTMHEELKDKPLLTNNSLMYHAYDLMGMDDKAKALRKRIRGVHLQDGRCIDYPGSDRFDPLGAAFAIRYRVMTNSNKLVDLIQSVDTPYGVTIKCRHNPHSPEEKPVIERTDGVVVWPFVVGFTILALKKFGLDKFAREQFNKLLKLDGFHEWYDPATGKGYGDQEQLWSATLFMQAVMEVSS